jgi:PTH1 family peptidyl-tRNA hydrolase
MSHTLDAFSMKLIVGLGNPGEKYENTRHNLGFDVLSHFLQDSTSVQHTNWSTQQKLKSEIAQLDGTSKIHTNEKIILAKPLTYMNNSGMAVRLIADYYKIDSSDIWVVYDELDLPVGSLKIRFGGSGAGHHGIESIIDALGTDKFWRFRLGIGVARNHKELGDHHVRDAADFVLDTFSSGEKGKVRELMKRAQKALCCALEEDLESAMNQYNSK